MKRKNFLFDEISRRDNVRLAFLKAIRGNRSSPQSVYFCRNIDRNLRAVQENLRSPDFRWGGYRSFLIKDPKLRTISTAPFAQRVMHHAIMNVIEPVLERPLVFHSYACRRGKGTHAAVLYAFRQCRANRYFLKLDVRRYFESVDHGVLKSVLRRFIKDARLAAMLDGIIGSWETAPGKGIPVGNLTSQFFANLYLSGMDHFILEKLRPAGYCRYMDDFVVWSPSEERLVRMRGQITEYARCVLRLDLKPAVFGRSVAGLPFLGFLVREKGIFLMQKSKRRVKRRMAEISASLLGGCISQEKAARRVSSVFAAVALARTLCFRRNLCKKWGRLPAATASNAAGVGTIRHRTPALPTGTTTTATTTTLASGWSVPELCGGKD